MLQPLDVLLSHPPPLLLPGALPSCKLRCQVEAGVKEQVGALLVTRDVGVQREVLHWAWLLRKAAEEEQWDTIPELLGEMVE